MEVATIMASISEETIVETIESLGGQEDHRSDRHIWYNTVCHGGDSHKLCYNRATKDFYCYTECGYMDFAGFLQHVLHISFPSALSYLRNMARKGIGHQLIEVHADLEEVQQVVKLLQKQESAFRFQDLQTHVLECFESDVFYEGWINEGISVETMQVFGIQWDEVTKSIVIPHYDINGQLVGIRTRQIDATTAKYMPLKMNGQIFSHPLGMNLYGAYLHKDAIKQSRQAIVVESEKSVMKHHTWFGFVSNVVAVCGFNITAEQKRLLLEMGVEEVVLAFDKDVWMIDSEEELTPEYERYCKLINRFGRQLAPYCRVTALVDNEDLLGLKDAPMDQGKEVFVELMKNRQEIIC